jgi:hypothetical protein
MGTGIEYLSPENGAPFAAGAPSVSQERMNFLEV